MSHAKWFIFVSVSIFLTGVFANAQQSKPEPDWSSMTFLIGDWVGEGGGKPGEGAGAASFNFDLQRKIIVRKNQSDYLATKDKPAISHTDLMIIYPDASGKRFQAVYFDNEGYKIDYKIAQSDDHKTLVFTSEAIPSAPRFRLVYTKVNDDTLTVRFDMAPPGKPDAFSKYVEGTMHRK